MRHSAVEDKPESQGETVVDKVDKVNKIDWTKMNSAAVHGVDKVDGKE